MIYLRNFMLVLSFLITTIIAMPVLLLRPCDSRNASMVSRLFGTIASILMNIRTDYEGLEKIKDDSPAIYIANHQHNYDVVIFSRYLANKALVLGKKSLQYIPVFGQLFWLSGHIFIDRKNKTKAFSVMDQVVDRIIKDKVGLFIFPEGTRSKGKGMLPFKKGAFYVAIKTKTPIVPMISCSYKNVNLTSIFPPKFKIQILDQIDTSEYDISQVEQLRVHCEEVMRKALKELDNSYL